MRFAFAGGGSSPAGDRVEGGDVFVASRGFLGFDLEQPWGASGRRSWPPAGAVLVRLGTRKVVIGALVGTVTLSSAKVLSFHSSSGSPFGWVQDLRNWEKALHSPYFC